MVKQKTIISLFICFIATTFLSGCCCLECTVAKINWAMNPPILRVYIKDNIRVDGRIKKSDPNKTDYISIYIGTPESHVVNFPPIYVKWPDGEKVLISDVTADKITKLDIYPSKGEDIDSIFPLDGSWPLEAKSYWSSEIHYSFILLNDQVVGFHIWEGTNFWHGSAEKLYAFPLTDEQVVELFGEPDYILTDKQIWADFFNPFSDFTKHKKSKK